VPEIMGTQVVIRISASNQLFLPVTMFFYEHLQNLLINAGEGH